MADYPATIIARMWSKVDIPTAPRSNNLCWLWTGSTAKGYGQIKVGKNVLRVHRVVHEWANGPVPDDMTVMHTCDTPRCCNPAHLKVGTHADNMADKAAKGRAGKRRA
jgi:hypothetical protein